jgi:hypothetical protein
MAQQPGPGVAEQGCVVPTGSAIKPAEAGALDKRYLGKFPYCIAHVREGRCGEGTRLLRNSLYCDKHVLMLKNALLEERNEGKF